MYQNSAVWSTLTSSQALKERWPRCGAASTGCCRRVEDVILLQESSLQQGHHPLVTMWVVRPSCILNFSPHTSQSNICRFGNSSLSSFIGDTGLDFTLSELLIIFWKILICVSFPLVYLHTSFRFETVSTNVTLESVLCLKGEGDSWTHVEGEVEGEALVGQRLAEVQTFGKVESLLPTARNTNMPPCSMADACGETSK